MSFELDHVFVAASPGAPEIGLLTAAGFTEGPPNDHPGQGTACRRVFFTNAYLELIWLIDVEAARAPSIRRTGLDERADPTSSACPFGFGLRPPEEAGTEPPFRCWPYTPPYLPAGVSFAVGCNSENLREPLLFVLPWSGTAGRPRPEHPNGARRVTRVGFVPGPAEARGFSEELAAFYGLGLVALEDGPEPLLMLELDERKTGAAVDLRPQLPLSLCW